jgi:hypothetical protein
MSLKISAECDELLARQDGVIGRSQGLELGISGYSMRHRARVGEWQRIQRGVYAAFSGEVTREARLWAALLRTGPGAVLSHQTAAELYGLIKEPRPLIHVTVPADSNPAKSARIPGVMVHRSRILDRTRHPVLLPPRTRIEDTVLDLMEEMDSPADRYDLMSFPSPSVRRAGSPAVRASTWTTCMRITCCAWNWTGPPPIPPPSNGAISEEIGVISPPSKSSRCASGIRI